MELQERIALFRGMIGSCYRIYHWEYDAGLKLIRTDFPMELPWDTVSEMLGLRAGLAAQKGSVPVILDTGFGLVWLAGFSDQGEIRTGYHLFGPMFTGANSPVGIRHALMDRGMQGNYYVGALHLLQDVPLIPSSTLAQYGVMLYYALTGEEIPLTEIRTVAAGNAGEETKKVPQKKMEKEPAEEQDAAVQIQTPQAIWQAEQRFLDMVREGNPQMMDTLGDLMALSSGMQIESVDLLRYAKDNTITLLTLVSRAAIEGGLAPDVALAIADRYLEQIEHCVRFAAVSDLAVSLIRDYTERVRKVREKSDISPVIRNACMYIQLHLTEDVSIRELAAMTGYTDYYFSARFRKETGKTVREYITEKRLERAAELLTGTSMRMSEIWESLGFGSRSYFYAAFEKWAGVTPGAFRRS